MSLIRELAIHGFLVVCVASVALLTPWRAVAAPAPEIGSPQVLPGQVDLSSAFEKMTLPRRTQGARPTCSVFVVAGAIEFAVGKVQGQGTRLSVEYLNWAGNQVAGGKEDGGFFSDLWRGFEAHGICSEKLLPYAPSFDPGLDLLADAIADAANKRTLGLRYHWIKEWDVKTGLTKAHVAAIKQTLATGWPVCAGLRWPKKEIWKESVLQLCGPEAVRDGHSVLLVGYKDDAAQPGGGVFTFRNSSNRGEDGAMPYAYAEAYMNDAAWIDSPSSKLH